MPRLAAVLLLAATATAQIPTYPHLVLTRLAGSNPAAQILEVEPTTGAAQPLGRFPSDVMLPLAVTIDPFDGSPIVALVSAGTQSRIVRLERSGAAFLEFHITDVPGAVTGMAVQQNDLLVSVDGSNGGLYRMGRRGGAPTVVLAQSNTTAMHGYGPYGTIALIAWTGRPGTAAIDSGVALVDTTTGAMLLGPHTFANPTGLELTSAFDLPTGVPRQLLSFADGTFALFAGLIGPRQPVVTSPVIPAGGAVAMHQIGAYGFSPLAVGGAPYPYLYDVDPWLGFVTVRSVALPGAPVDFVSGLDRGAQGLQFSERCGTISLFGGWSGLQQPGNSFALTVQGPVNGYAVLAIGLTDFAFGAFPFALPGGCLLEVSPDAVVFHLLGASGAASQSIAVPAGPAFLGVQLFNQWLHLDVAGISVSAAAAHRIGL